MMKPRHPKNAELFFLKKSHYSWSKIRGVWILTVYIIETRETSGLSRKEVKSFSANMHTGAEITVPHKLYMKTTVISWGYTSMILVWKSYMSYRVYQCATPTSNKVFYFMNCFCTWIINQAEISKYCAASSMPPSIQLDSDKVKLW